MTKPLLAKSIGEELFTAMQNDPIVFVRAFDKNPWSFQEDILRQILARKSDGKFRKPITVCSMPRQNGKSMISAWCALWRFFCDPDHQEIISVAIDRSSASIILNEARRIISNSSILYDLVDPNYGLTKSEIRQRDGRRWIIKSADAVYCRGLRPSTICYDEMAFCSDDGDLYSVLSAGQAAVRNPLILITSTVGPIQAGPLWELFQANERGDPSVRLIYHTENLSPLISEDYLERQRSLLPPFVYAREHQNLWGEGSDAFCTQADWQKSSKNGDPRRDRDSGPCYLFCDLGWLHNETVVVVSKQDGDIVEIIALESFQGSQSNPVKFSAVQMCIEELVQRLNVKRIEIESPQGMFLAENLRLPDVDVNVLHPTAKSNRERWGALYTHLKNGSVRLPNDAKLRRQLLTLTIKESARGWKVIDIPSIHNDRAVAVAGALFLASAKDKWVSIKFMAVTKYGVLGPDLKPIKMKESPPGEHTTEHDFIRQEEIRQLRNLSESRKVRIWQMHSTGKSIPTLQRQFSLSQWQIEKILQGKILEKCS